MVKKGTNNHFFCATLPNRLASRKSIRLLVYIDPA